MMKRLIALLCMVMCHAVAFSASWGDAEWIWQQEDGPSNTWMCFRKSVQLDEIPSEVVASIAVDSKFWMWINGEMVVFEGGLSRGPSQAGEWNRKEGITPANSWYEDINIKPYLREGENTIAILVWYWGRETHKGTHVDSGKGGLLFYSKIGDQEVVSNDSWRAIQHPSYDNTIAPSGKMVVQYSVKYDAQSDMADGTANAWYGENFADNQWSMAVEKGKAGSAPFYDMEKNIVPRLLDHGLQDYVNNDELKMPFVSNGKMVAAKLPINKQITPYFEIEAKAGDTIHIATDNRLNQIKATYITKEGVQSFECLSWMNGHEVRYTFPKGVKVNALKYRWMSVGEMEGSFEVDDPFYSRLWWMGNNTLFVCARDNFMDCPDRERALWIGDVADQTGYLFYTMGDAGRQLLKKAILQTVRFSENSVLGALGPLRVRELVGQSLQFISNVVLPYYMNTGDKETLEIAYPYLYNYLALFPMAENGLPEYRRGKSPDTWDWLDWGVANTIDNRPIQPAYYYQALVAAQEMAEILNNNEHDDFYADRIKSIEENYDKVFWKDGFYSSNPAKFKDDRANAIAVVSGLAKAENYKAIVDNVLMPNRFSSPHFEWLVEQAIFMAGFPEKSLERMKDQYADQVNSGLSTLYEKYPKGGSYNHAWNGSNTVLSKHLAGVEPTKVAWSEFQVAPTLAHIKNLKCLVPSVKGDIKIEMNSSDNSYTLQLTAPKESAAIIGIPKSGKQIESVELNGRKVWKKGKFRKSRGGVEFVSDDSDYLKFRVPSGDWSVEAELI